MNGESLVSLEDRIPGDRYRDGLRRIGRSEGQCPAVTRVIVAAGGSCSIAGLKVHRGSNRRGSDLRNGENEVGGAGVAFILLYVANGEAWDGVIVDNSTAAVSVTNRSINR